MGKKRKKKRKPYGKRAGVFITNFKRSTPIGELRHILMRLLDFIGIQVSRNKVHIVTRRNSRFCFIYFSDENLIEYIVEKLNNEELLINEFEEYNDLVEEGQCLRVEKKYRRENEPGTHANDNEATSDSEASVSLRSPRASKPQAQAYPSDASVTTATDGTSYTSFQTSATSIQDPDYCNSQTSCTSTDNTSDMYESFPSSHTSGENSDMISFNPSSTTLETYKSFKDSSKGKGRKKAHHKAQDNEKTRSGSPPGKARKTSHEDDKQPSDLPHAKGRKKSQQDVNNNERKRSVQFSKKKKVYRDKSLTSWRDSEPEIGSSESDHEPSEQEEDLVTTTTDEESVYIKKAKKIKLGSHSDSDIAANSSCPSTPGSSHHHHQYYVIDPQATDMKKVVRGAYLGTETRNVEFKAGSGRYLQNTFRRHIEKYIPAFLNSDGGQFFVGVNDQGIVEGTPIGQKEEDRIRLMIDEVIKGIRPRVFPDNYRVRFIPVTDFNRSQEQNLRSELKVLEVQIQRGTHSELYQNQKGEVFIRRDGSVEGPLRPNAIQALLKGRLMDEKNRHHISELSSKGSELLLEMKALRQKLSDARMSNEKNNGERKNSSKQRERLQMENRLLEMSESLEKLERLKKRKRGKTEDELLKLEQEMNHWIDRSKTRPPAKRKPAKSCNVM